MLRVEVVGRIKVRVHAIFMKIVPDAGDQIGLRLSRFAFVRPQVGQAQKGGAMLPRNILIALCPLILSTVAFAQAAPGAPQAQVDFLDAVFRARLEYNHAKTDFQRGAARPKRAEALCRVLRNKRAELWVGKVNQLTTNSDGWGVIKIDIGRNAYVKTWNNSISDAFHKTLVNPSSKVFGAASTLNKGDEVIFSAQFFPSDTDCVHEGSLTLGGSITEPEFIVRFTELAKR